MTEILEGLKEKARDRGLWNFWLNDSELGHALSTVEYAYLAQEMKTPFQAEVFNCSAPDTGNMEVLLKYGSDAHKQRWLTPLLDGKIRSAYLMTEPDVASSDATTKRIPPQFCMGPAGRYASSVLPVRRAPPRRSGVIADHPRGSDGVDDD